MNPTNEQNHSIRLSKTYGGYLLFAIVGVFIVFSIASKEFSNHKENNIFGTWNGKKNGKQVSLTITNYGICSLILSITGDLVEDIVNATGRCKLMMSKSPKVLKFEQIDGIQGPLYFSFVQISNHEIRVSSLARRWRVIDINPQNFLGITLNRETKLKTSSKF